MQKMNLSSINNKIWFKNLAEVNSLVNFAVVKIEYMANREIKFYKHYFNEFYVAQTDKVRKKIAQTLVWLQTLDRLPITILKSIEGKKDFLK